MKKIMQFRYFGPDHEQNQPLGLTSTDLSEGNIFASYPKVSQLGIQGPPGIKFYINDNINNPIFLGDTGIYELDLEGLGIIYQLNFDKSEMDTVITGVSENRLLIDIIYEGG